MINLGFEWMIDGDDNRNATVEVSYRKKGDRDWKEALPLLRLQHERINRDPQQFSNVREVRSSYRPGSPQRTGE